MTNHDSNSNWAPGLRLRSHLVHALLADLAAGQDQRADDAQGWTTSGTPRWMAVTSRSAPPKAQPDRCQKLLLALFLKGEMGGRAHAGGNRGLPLPWTAKRQSEYRLEHNWNTVRWLGAGIGGACGDTLTWYQSVAWFSTHVQQ
jgi:hypothetical protein